MRLLVLAPQVPWPLRQGTAIRNFHVASQLARRHEVTLLAFGNPDGDGGPLAEAGVRVHAVPPPPRRGHALRLVELAGTPTPDLARRLASAPMAARLQSLWAEAGPFDVVQIEGFEMAPYGLASLSGGAPRPRLVYDAHNAEWVLQDRAWRADIRRPGGLPGALYSLVQTAKIRRFERRLLEAADATVAVSEADARALARLAPGAAIQVVPNGVDLAAYAPADPAAVDADLCVFTGKMDFRPNIDAMAWFCRHVWPRVRASRPGARLAIVGREPVERVRRLADASRGVEVTGEVPDVRPWLARAGLVVVPLRVGGGTRLKVLEAMAAAKAIVATTMAVEGLVLTDGAEAALADRPEDLALRIVALMADPEARAALGRRARRRAEADYAWEALVPRIEALYGDPPP